MHRIWALLFTSILLAADPVAQITALADQVAPELGADALLRLIEKGRITGLPTQKKLIARAHELARLAKDPVRRLPIPGLGPAKADDIALDRLSLETRAIFALTQLDPELGAKAFRYVIKPTPRKITCADGTYDDVTAYAALLRIFGKTEDKLAFVQSLSSHAELSPAAWIADEDVVKGALPGALARLTGDERLFTGLLPDTLAKYKAIPALADYVKRNLEAEACKESSVNGWQRNTRAAAAAAFKFELKPPTFGEGFENRGWLEDDRESQTLFQSLLFARNKNAPEWFTRFAEYLKRIRDGKASFDRQAEMFGAAYIVSPRGLIREDILIEYINVLAQASLQRESPQAWYRQAIALPATVSALPEAEYESVLRGYERSGNPGLVLIASQQRLGL